MRTPNVRSVDLRLLQVFATIVECRGFTAAQVELGLSQSTISSYMAELEARLTARLCERGRGGFRLTEEGRLVHEATQRLFRSLDTFASEVGVIRGRLIGELHIGMVDNIVSHPECPIPEAFRRFKSRDGDVQLHLHVGAPSEIERAVLDGRYHLGVGGYTSRAPGLAYLPLFRERQWLYCGARHPLFARPERRIRTRDIQACDYVRRLYVSDSDLPLSFRGAATAAAENMEAIAHLILSGRFIGFLPVHYAARWVERGEMRALKPRRITYSSQLELITRRTRPKNAAIDVFLADFLAAAGLPKQPAAS